MMSFTDLTSVPADHPAPFADQLRLAVAAYLARFTGASRQHTEFVTVPNQSAVGAGRAVLDR